MVRRTRSQYNFLTQEFDELLLPTSGSGRRSTFPRRGKISHIDIHHMTVPDSDDGAACRACVEIWKKREASSHYGIDKWYVAQFVYDNREAWGNANLWANQTGIIIEHANSTIGDAKGWEIDDETLATSVKLVAGLHITHGLGRPTSTGFGDAGTIRTHHSFYATSCPGPYFKKQWKSYVKRVQVEYDRLRKGTPVVPKTKLVRHFEHRHLNTHGDDSAEGTRTILARMDDMVKDLVSGVNPEVITLNEVRPNQIASWRKRLGNEGYDTILAAAGNLIAVPAGSEVAKVQTKYLPENIQGLGRKEALGMARVKINGHWEHIFVSHLDYRDGAKFDAIRVKQAKWIAKQAKAWSVAYVLKSWTTHTSIGIDENSSTWVRDKAFTPAGLKAAIKRGIDAIYGNRQTSKAYWMTTESDHPIIAAVYVKKIKV